MLNHIPPQFQTQIDNAISFLKPFTKRAYLVGGSVRDLSLGQALHDLDVEVYDIEPLAFDALMQKMGAVGVGKSFFVPFGTFLHPFSTAICGLYAANIEFYE